MNWRSPSSINSLSKAVKLTATIWAGTRGHAIADASCRRITFTQQSRYLVHHHLVGDAAQRGFLLDRPDRLILQNGGDAGRLDGGRGDVNLLRRRQALHARGDVDGLAEIVLPLVQHHRKAGAFMYPDLDDQILLAALAIERLHGFAHAQARDDGVLGADE